MIIIAASGATLRTNHYIHHRDQVVATSSMLSNVDTDCCFCSCESVIPAFAYLDDEDNADKNDIYSWILKVPDNCTVVATLTNLDTGTEYVITDQTYGNFYDVNELKDNVWGFVIHWVKVADLIGFGNYQLNIETSNATPTVLSSTDSPKFQLMPYTCESAHNTVRIQTVNTGYIEGGFDYRGIIILNPFGGLIKGIEGWVKQVRWWGRIDVIAHPVQIDNLSDNYRNLLQVQTQIETEYNLRLEFIPTDVSNQIIYDYLLSDYLLISDYNANNIDSYKNKKVSLLNIDNPQPFLNKTVLYNIKFVNFTQNNLKRFY